MITSGQWLYRKYLRGPHWRKLRYEAFKKHGFSCSKCQSRSRLQPHHKTYRSLWESCTVDDLIILCRDCHRKEHGLKPIKPRKKKTKQDHFIKLPGHIISSSVWDKSDSTRLVWITMLLAKNKKHQVIATVEDLAGLARVGLDECVKAIEDLSMVDEYSRSKKLEGRRIREIPGGWEIINGAKWNDYHKKARSFYG